MLNIVSLLVAAALVSMQCGIEVNALSDRSRYSIDKLELLQKKVLPPGSKPRRLRKVVRIWTKPPAEISRFPAEQYELVCEAVGNPPPSVRWLRNGEIIQDHEEEFNEILPQGSFSLAKLISKYIVTTPYPGEEKYTCLASSGVTTDSATTTVFTLPNNDDEEDLLSLQKLLVPSKPIITDHFEDLLQEIGSGAVLPCRVSSATETQIYWLDENDRVIYGNSRMKVLPSGDLVINSLIWGDMGNFTCVAKNSFGKDTAMTFIYPTKPSKSS